MDEIGGLPGGGAEGPFFGFLPGTVLPRAGEDGLSVGLQQLEATLEAKLEGSHRRELAEHLF